MDELGSTRIKKTAASGFTLLETLISLAILSVVSLALFQSTSSLLRITSRAVNAGERALETAVSRKTFRASVRGLTPGWKEEPENVFKGDASQFSGISTGAPTFSSHTLKPFSFALVRQTNGRIALKVNVNGQVWDLQEFSADEAAFSYLGTDQKWYREWPPKNTPAPGFFNDEIYMDTPQLPLAIRLHGEYSNHRFDWVAAVLGAHDLPYRDRF
ncbi:MAG: prepilin-type N-terminal cleavage/methylation domain-containing protein [Phycisphaerales bacterium]|nr:prepilin-type N-terminal cleavage/methylation domain-containing protein [Phycisphaerales bacterium]